MGSSLDSIHRDQGMIMAILGFIDDGQTLTRFIKGRARLWSDCRITFRATAPKDHAIVERKVKELYDRGKRAEAEEMVYETIAKRILRWDFLDDNGVPINGAPAVSADAIKRTVTGLQDRFIAIVYSGVDGGDPDPADEEQSTESARTHMEETEKNSMQP
jgi:hypothetical protein